VPFLLPVRIPVVGKPRRANDAKNLEDVGYVLAGGAAPRAPDVVVAALNVDGAQVVVNMASVEGEGGGAGHLGLIYLSIKNCVSSVHFLKTCFNCAYVVIVRVYFKNH
jgi:hypothetical protein